MKQRPVTVLGTMKAKAGQEDDVKRRIIALAGPSRSEAGCLGFDVHQGNKDRTLFMSYENWASQAALNSHLAQPYMRDFFAEAAELLDGQPDITLWNRLNRGSDRPNGQGGSDMGSHDETVVDALNAIANRIGTSLDSIAGLLASGGGSGNPQSSSGHPAPLHASSDAPKDAVSDPREHAFLRYTVGKGTFSKDDGMRYSALNCRMYKMDGERDGTFVGVWEPQVTPTEMTSRPKPPTGPFDEPQGDVPKVWPGAFTKAVWTFRDSSSITAVGPAMLHLVPLTDGSQIFLVSVAGIITNGTGIYEGAHGVKTALGATFVPPGTSMFDPNLDYFDAVTIETFRVVLRKDIKK